MRILIVFHGRLPGGPWPVVGMALRAWSNGCGLQAHGIEVSFASRRRDLVGTSGADATAAVPVVHPFETREELLALVQTLSPDAVLAEGTDALETLHGCKLPLILDLFAPRVLEAQWQAGDGSGELVSLLDALARADYYLVTTPAQRAYYLGLLPLAGVDCREDRIALVPLSVPEAVLKEPPPLSETPVLLAGGVAWPWQDPSWGLQTAARVLESLDRGRLELLRGPYPLSRDDVLPLPPLAPGPRVSLEGLLPYPELLARIERAWAVLDVMAPNLERDLALSFRQLDALRAGTPLIVGARAPLAPLVERFGAGWVVPYGDTSRLEDVVRTVILHREEVEQRRSQVHALARAEFRAEQALAPLLERLTPPSRRTPRETLTAMLARRGMEAQAREQQLHQLERDHQALLVDVRKKDGELVRLGDQVSTLVTAQSRLSLALEASLAQQEALGLRTGQEEAEAHVRIRALERESASLQRTLARKEAARLELLAQREGLEADVSRLESEVQQQSQRGSAAQLERVRLATLLQEREEERVCLRQEREILLGERDKKQQELAVQWELRESLLEQQRALTREVEQVRMQAEGRVEVAERERDQVAALLRDCEEQRVHLRSEQESLLIERDKKQQELAVQWELRESLLEQQRALILELEHLKTRVEARHQRWLEQLSALQAAHAREVQAAREALPGGAEALRQWLLEPSIPQAIQERLEQARARLADLLGRSG